MKTIDKIFDATTGEETITERDMTPQELAEYESAIARLEAEKLARDEAQAKRAIALAKLEALGLDIEDLQALGLGGN